MSDHVDNEFADNKKISALYRTGSTAQPPTHIDQAILAEARRSVSPTPKRLRPSWAVPVSMAAVLVLSVSLITLIHEEAPTISDIASTTAPPLSVIHSDAHVEETEITEKDIVEEQKKERLVQTPEIIARQKSQKTVRQENAVNKIKKSDHVTSSASVAESSVTLQPAPDMKQKPTLTSDIPLEPGDKIMGKSTRLPGLQPENQLRLSDEIADSRTEFSPGLPPSNVKDNKNCELLSHSACLESKKCTLMMDEEKTLMCRHSINHCDTGFLQQSDTKEMCEAKNGCVYVSRPCFCPPNIVCICDGDKLSQCQPRQYR